MSPALTYISFIRYCDFEVFRQQRFMIDGASAHAASIVHPDKKEDLSHFEGPLFRHTAAEVASCAELSPALSFLSPAPKIRRGRCRSFSHIR